MCGEIWQALRQGDLIVENDVAQLYDPEAGTFLADRFVKGKCPKCGAPDQYGDNCDKCGSTYRATDLVDPVSTLSGAKPELRSERHLFVQLDKLHDFLTEWTQSGRHLQPEVANYLKGHFLNEPLRDWDISRPAPYFGFEIPDSPGNYWYVWFDAPIGYMASTRQWCDARRSVRRLVAQRRCRDPPFYWQGYYVLPYAVLARHAQVIRLLAPDKSAHSWLSDRGWREDVEIEGHVCHGGNVRPVSGSELSALLLRLEAGIQDLTISI